MDLARVFCVELARNASAALALLAQPRAAAPVRPRARAAPRPTLDVEDVVRVRARRRYDRALAPWQGAVEGRARADWCVQGWR